MLAALNLISFIPFRIRGQSFAPLTVEDRAILASPFEMHASKELAGWRPDSKPASEYKFSVVYQVFLERDADLVVTLTA